MNEQIHGMDIADPYRWLEDADQPKVKEWIEKENDRTNSSLRTPAQEA